MFKKKNVVPYVNTPKYFYKLTIRREQDAIGDALALYTTFEEADRALITLSKYTTQGTRIEIERV